MVGPKELGLVSTKSNADNVSKLITSVFWCPVITVKSRAVDRSIYLFIFGPFCPKVTVQLHKHQNPPS